MILGCSWYPDFCVFYGSNIIATSLSFLFLLNICIFKQVAKYNSIIKVYYHLILDSDSYNVIFLFLHKVRADSKQK